MVSSLCGSILSSNRYSKLTVLIAGTNTAAICVLKTKIPIHNKSYLMPWTSPVPAPSLPLPLAVQATAVTVSSTSGARQLTGTAEARHVSSILVFTVYPCILPHQSYILYKYHSLYFRGKMALETDIYTKHI